jgi:Predicted divalent heavy-metal cations transporter
MFLPHLHPGAPPEETEGVKTTWHRSMLLVSAITLHNIPEGLAIGVAFGAAGSGLSGATLGGAIALSIGIGIQNFPEGLQYLFHFGVKASLGERVSVGAGFCNCRASCRSIRRSISHSCWTNFCHIPSLC